MAPAQTTDPPEDPRRLALRHHLDCGVAVGRPDLNPSENAQPMQKNPPSKRTRKATPLQKAKIGSQGRSPSAIAPARAIRVAPTSEVSGVHPPGRGQTFGTEDALWDAVFELVGPGPGGWAPARDLRRRRWAEAAEVARVNNPEQQRAAFELGRLRDQVERLRQLLARSKDVTYAVQLVDDYVKLLGPIAVPPLNFHGWLTRLVFVWDRDTELYLPGGRMATVDELAKIAIRSGYRPTTDKPLEQRTPRMMIDLVKRAVRDARKRNARKARARTGK
jgi:hypothetical protein